MNKKYLIILGIIVLIITSSVFVIKDNKQKTLLEEKDAKISQVSTILTEITNENNELKVKILEMDPLYLYTQQLISEGNSCYISSCTGDIETYEGKEGMVVGFNGDNLVIVQKDGTLAEIPRISSKQKRP